MNLDFHLCRSQVIYAFSFDFTLFDSLGDTLDQCANGFGERQLANDECLLVKFLNLGAHFQHTAALAIIIFRYIDASTCLEVGEEMKFLFMQIADGSITNFAEVMRQNL